MAHQAQRSPSCGPAVEDETEPWPRENLPTGAGPWRQTMLMRAERTGHDGNVPMRLHNQLCWSCLADPQLRVTPLQTMLALSRAMLTPLQATWRLSQTTQSTTLEGERGRMLAPLRAKVTPLQTIWRLFQARMMPFQAN